MTKSLTPRPGRHLEWIGEALPKMMARAVPARTMPTDERWIEVLHSLWGETWVPMVSLADEARDSDARVVALAGCRLVPHDYEGERLRRSFGAWRLAVTAPCRA